MPTKRRADGHNVRVTRSGLPRRTRTALVAGLLAPVLVLSACGAKEEKKPSAQPSVDLPTGSVDVPEGVTMTKAGTQLKFGEPATVAYEPNTKRSSVIELTVDSVQAGRIADFAAYQLNARTKTSRPYYVRVHVKNVGTGDLSRAPVPLYAVDTRNTLIQPSSFNNTFKKCPSTPLPAGFGPGKAMSGCLVYLVPAGGTLVEMSFRPLQDFEPITWKGTITPAVTKKPTKKPAKKPSKKQTRKAQP
jgi:hypothetical protein